MGESSPPQLDLQVAAAQAAFVQKLGLIENCAQALTMPTRAEIDRDGRLALLGAPLELNDGLLGFGMRLAQDVFG